MTASDSAGGQGNQELWGVHRVRAHGSLFRCGTRVTNYVKGRL